MTYITGETAAAILSGTLKAGEMLNNEDTNDYIEELWYTSIVRTSAKPLAGH